MEMETLSLASLHSSAHTEKYLPPVPPKPSLHLSCKIKWICKQNPTVTMPAVRHISCKFAQPACSGLRCCCWMLVMAHLPATLRAPSQSKCPAAGDAPAAVICPRCFMLLSAPHGMGIGLQFSLCWHLWVVVLKFSFAWAHSWPTVLGAVLPLVQNSTPACHVWGWAAFHKPLLHHKHFKALWLMVTSLTLLLLQMGCQPANVRSLLCQTYTLSCGTQHL